MVVRACNLSYSGGWGRRIAWTQEAEVAVSREEPLHSSKSKTPSQEEKKKAPIMVETTFFQTSVNADSPTSSHESQMILMASRMMNPSQVFHLLCPDPSEEPRSMVTIAL